MFYALSKRSRACAAVALAVAGCGSQASQSAQVDRFRDATGCLAETMATYAGKTYVELAGRVGGEQAARKCKKQGHAYEVLVTVSPDVEHPPHRIQIDFDVFDDDNPPTMNPINESAYLEPGQALDARLRAIPEH